MQDVHDNQQRTGTASRLDASSLRAAAPLLSALPAAGDREFWDTQNRRAEDYRRRTWLREANEIIEASEVPRHHLEAVASTWGPEWRDALAYLVARLGRGFIFALLGPRGVGKTELAAAMICAAARADLRRSRYTTATMMLGELRPMRFDAAARRMVWNRYVLPPLLIVDEVTEAAVDASSFRDFVEVMDGRYRSGGRDTVLISNADRDSFEVLVGPNVVDRMRERGGIIPCTWQSFRSPARSADRQE